MTTGRLTRQLSRIDGLAIGIGGVIGTGIFRTTGPILRSTGGPLGATVVWVVTGLASLVGAFLYADLSARVPEAGGPYAYVREAFGRRVAFVDGWIDAGVMKPMSQAAGVAIIGEILSQRTGIDAPKTFAAATFALLVGLTLLGVKAGALAQRVFTGTKLLTIAFVLALAFAAVPHPSAVTAPAPLDVVTALSGAWYTYLGWPDVALLSEELENPKRDMRPVLVGTVSTTILAYTAFHGAMLFGLGDGAEARSDLPALLLARDVMGSGAETLLSAALVAAMLGGLAEGLLVRPRVAFALARDGLAPAFLASTSASGMPRRATLAHSAIVMALVLSGGFAWLLPPLVFAQAAEMLLESCAYFPLRKRGPSPQAVKPWVAGLFVAVNATLVGWVAFTHPWPCLGVSAVAGVLALAYGRVAVSRALSG
jgi:APA family basic amino acid/polyamine antiporter